MCLALGMGPACVPPGEVGDGLVERTPAALNGMAVFPDGSCAGLTTKIQQSVTAAFNNLSSPAMDDCMRQAIMSYNVGAFAELALAEARQNFATSITCVNTLPPGAAGEANELATGEALRLLTSFVSDPNTSTAAIAALVLHEILHNRRYGHPTPSGPNANFMTGWSNVQVVDSLDYRTAIHNQIQKCSRDISAGATPPRPNFRRRDDLPNESTLSPVGKAAGAIFEIACDPGLMAKGLRHRSGTEVDALGL